MLTTTRHHDRPGTAPGTLLPPKVKRLAKTTIHLIQYNETTHTEQQFDNADEALASQDMNLMSWFNVSGLHDIELIRKLGQHHNLHNLALEDLLNLSQRPKMEEYEDHLFVVFKMAKAQSPEEVEQVAMFIKDNVLITFHEMQGDVFAPIRHRLKAGKNRIRRSGSDFLAYALIDQAVDELYPLLEGYSDSIEALEENMMIKPVGEHLEAAHRLKRGLLAFKRVIWPERELINKLLRDESGLISDSCKLYLRDVHDHSFQLVEITETYRDMTMDLIDLYLSSISNHMNQVMKVLTMIATVFIPMTFIASIYGMNFNSQSSPLNMPELQWYWGYPLALGTMLIIALIMLSYFRRKSWL